MSDPKIMPPTTDEEPPMPPPKDEKPGSGGKRSAWMAHVRKTMRANKGLKLKQVLKMASKTFKKTKKGGASITPHPVGGKRRSRSRRAY